MREGLQRGADSGLDVVEGEGAIASSSCSMRDCGVESRCERSQASSGAPRPVRRTDRTTQRRPSTSTSSIPDWLLFFSVRGPQDVRVSRSGNPQISRSGVKPRTGKQQAASRVFMGVPRTYGEHSIARRRPDAQPLGATVDEPRGYRRRGPGIRTSALSSRDRDGGRRTQGRLRRKVRDPRNPGCSVANIQDVEVRTASRRPQRGRDIAAGPHRRAARGRSPGRCSLCR